MKAAVVTEFGRPPQYADFADPEPAEGEVLVEVVAAGLHQLVRGRVAGRHYSIGGELPQIAGADGVARLTDGRFAWFGGVRSPWGTMADRAPVREGTWLVLPEGADPVNVAGQLNPAMSGWLALTTRAQLEPGQTVVVLGATGASGRQAVQIAKLLGAGQVVALGRNAQALEALTELGADRTIRLSDDGELLDPLGSIEPDVILDYLWGRPAMALLAAALEHRPDPGRPLTLVQVGSMAGPEAQFPSAGLRSNNLRILGSGLGSTPMAEVFREMPRVLAEVAAGRFDSPVLALPLSEVETVWSREVAAGERIVLLP